MPKSIRLRGVRVHNLKNIDIDIPVNSLTVVTGPSGSGKSSLAFDTLYAEGRRRFVQSLSAYARQFIEKIERPDADLIESVFPAIAIHQKNQITSSRSIVGTITEIYDYLRLLFARLGIVRDPATGELIRSHTTEDVFNLIRSNEDGERIWICFKPPQAIKAEILLQKGFIRVFDSKAPGKSARIESCLPKKIEQPVVVDRLVIGPDFRNRAIEAIDVAFNEGHGKMQLFIGDRWYHFDTAFRSSSGKEFIKPQPRLFSFNNPFGACPRCRGFGDIIGIDPRVVIPDPERSLEEGVIEPWRKSTRRAEQNRLKKFCDKVDIPMNIPWNQLQEEHRKWIYEGTKRFAGVMGFFARLEKKKYKMPVRVLLSRYRIYCTCPECRGTRLRPEARLVRIGKMDIGKLSSLPLYQLLEWLRDLSLTEFQAEVVKRVMEELQTRLRLLVGLGVGYLSLNRRANSLSGGEIQRINLATALGGGLVGTLFVLDEPTIGLHERDTDRLVKTLKSIRDKGNTVVVVEHDKNVMKNADYLIDLGPGAGRWGGEVIFSGTFSELLKDKRSITAKYLSGERRIPTNQIRRKSDKFINIINAKEHNLKNIDVDIPLNVFCAITGVSGSGKSTLIHDVLFANIMHSRGKWQKKLGNCDGIRGDHQIQTIEMVDQSPIGKSPRSNPTTFIKAYTEIRTIFADRFQAKIRGYKPLHFSFNVKGGRCETCRGNGEITVEMQFLPDVHIRCEDCNGKRFKREVLDIRFKSLNIYDALQLTVLEAIEVFREYSSLVRKLKILNEVGLGYLQLGQSATTLSGGEGQRIKLAYHMSKTKVQNSLFIFDEPTTGLHMDDIKKLLEAFRRLVFHGASVVVIEHNLDVIKNADWIIDLGPEGGDKGGWIVATGTPEEIAERKGSLTGRYLKKVLSKN